jgi:hypothetical protein
VCTPQCSFEVLCHCGKRLIERRAPSDKYIVMPGLKPACGREPHDLPQTPANAVSLDRIPDFL